ncbi:MAG: hypothetical protein Q7T61_17075 [Caulobacter sp.]|nr:hypothetical protein [Caulobacter sp.]
MTASDAPRPPTDARALITPLDHRADPAPAPASLRTAPTWAYVVRILYQGDPRGAFGLRININVPPDLPPEAGRQHPAFSARLDTAAIDGVDCFASLTLTAEPGAAPPAWPAIAVLLPGGETALLALQPAAPEARTRTWTFPAGAIEAWLGLVLQLTLPDLHIARQQNAITRCWTEWTEPTSATDPTPGPVQRSRVQSFPHPVAPHSLVAAALDIGPWTDDPAANPLAGAIAALAPADPPPGLALTVRYAYPLQLGDSAPDAPLAELPVLLLPPQAYGGAAPIIESMAAWRQSTAPAALDARWLFDLSLFSPLDPTGSPLLTLARLVSAVAD